MYKIIIADDENKIRCGLKALIHWEELNLQLEGECTDGDELINMLKTSSVDIVLTDMQMPGICGVELLRCLKENYPFLSLIVISGYDDFKYTKQAILSEAVDYILKPVDEDELNNALENAKVKAKENKKALIENEEYLYPEIMKYFYEISKREKTTPQSKNEKLSQNIRKYLEEHYDMHISLEELAKHFFSNKEYMSKIFKNYYGVSISDYLDHLRVKKANQMLMEGQQVKEISFNLGFYDESHFYKKYKKIMGMSPSEYINKIAK